MKIKALGVGGAINDGLPYNAFIVNDELLVESPPDIINSIFGSNLNLQKISTVYISHFHADHYFGIPFLFLRLFFEGSTTPVTVIGPSGLPDRVKQICELAFGIHHPMQKWISQYVAIHEIMNNHELKITPHYRLKPIEMFHMTQTYGFILICGGKRLAYLADTYWQDSLLQHIEGVDAIIVDLNGENTDEAKVHISENDLIEFALPYTATNVLFYGTHLRVNKTSDHERIQYLKPGDEIRI